MPPPNGSVPLIAPLGLDLAAAAAAAQALDALADSLQAVVRADADRLASVLADWDGFTRWWFDHHHADAIASVRQAARQASNAAVAVRQATVAAVVAHDRAVADARRDLEPVTTGARSPGGNP